MLELEQRVLDLFPNARRSTFENSNFSIIVTIDDMSVIIYKGQPNYIIAAPRIERIPCDTIEQVIVSLNVLKIRSDV